MDLLKDIPRIKNEASSTFLESDQYKELGTKDMAAKYCLNVTDVMEVIGSVYPALDLESLQCLSNKGKALAWRKAIHIPKDYPLYCATYDYDFEGEGEED